MKTARFVAAALATLALSAGVSAAPANAAGYWAATGPFGSLDTCRYNRWQYERAHWWVGNCYQLNFKNWYFDRHYNY